MTMNHDWHYTLRGEESRYAGRVATPEECERMRSSGVRIFVNGQQIKSAIAASPDKVLQIVNVDDQSGRRCYHLDSAPCDCPERWQFGLPEGHHVTCRLLEGDVRIEIPKAGT